MDFHVRPQCDFCISVKLYGTFRLLLEINIGIYDISSDITMMNVKHFPVNILQCWFSVSNQTDRALALSWVHPRLESTPAELCAFENLKLLFVWGPPPTYFSEREPWALKQSTRFAVFVISETSSSSAVHLPLAPASRFVQLFDPFCALS